MKGRKRNTKKLALQKVLSKVLRSCLVVVFKGIRVLKKGFQNGFSKRRLCACARGHVCASFSFTIYFPIEVFRVGSLKLCDKHKPKPTLGKVI